MTVPMDDDLAPARGVVIGILISIHIWIVLIAVGFALWWLS